MVVSKFVSFVVAVLNGFDFSWKRTLPIAQWIPIFILNVNFIPVDVGYQKLFILNEVNVWPSRRH